MISPICLGRIPIECAVPPRPSPHRALGSAPPPRHPGPGRSRHHAKGLTRETPPGSPTPQEAAPHHAESGLRTAKVIRWAGVRGRGCVS